MMSSDLLCSELRTDSSSDTSETSTTTRKYVKDADGKYVCPHCPVKEVNQNPMFYHIKGVHEKDFPFECAHCPTETRFLQRCSWLHHLATKHPKTPHPSETDLNPYAGKDYACPAASCELKSHMKGNVLIHYARTHCKDWIPAFAKKTPCEGCSKTYSSSSAYLHHAMKCFKKRAPEDHAKTLSLIK
jgi:hypothetical protein